jgi:hypothetical protein
MGKVKCKECLGCMTARWIDNRRYFYCDLCKLWYGGGKGSLIVVDSPYLIDSSEGKIDRRILEEKK